MIEVAITLSDDKYLEKYALWLEEFGLRAVRITDANDVSKYPLIVLSGGGDVGVETGAYMCKNPEKRIDGVKKDRDDLEFDIIDKALSQNKPILGVCRGFQVMNVFRGGKLWADIKDGDFDLKIHRDDSVEKSTDTIHLVKSENGNFYVKSHHHQGLRTLGESLFPTAYSDDGLIEAFISESGLWNAVQWHPERTDAGMGRLWFKTWLESVIGQQTGT